MSASGQNTTRQGHYLQACYLDGFLNPPSTQLWCYSRRRAAPYPAIPRKLARQRDFYRFPNAPPELNLEDFLERTVETPGLSALRELVSSRQPLSIEKRIDLARYVAYQEMRVPFAREVNREHAKKSIRNQLDVLEKAGAQKAEVIMGPMVEGELQLRDEPFTVFREDLESVLTEMESNPNTFDLMDMVDLANKMTSFYSSMRWTVLSARSSTSFITSDCPVYRRFANPGGDDALLRLDCSVHFPLIARAMLIMEHDPESLKKIVEETRSGIHKALPETDFRQITDKGVTNLNRWTAEHAHRWCFTGTKVDWIGQIMELPSKRIFPKFIEKGNLSGVRWRRAE